MAVLITLIYYFGKVAKVSTHTLQLKTSPINNKITLLRDASSLFHPYLTILKKKITNIINKKGKRLSSTKSNQEVKTARAKHSPAHLANFV